jgi:imidazolonepropionase-like amidohydrolase
MANHHCRTRATLASLLSVAALSACAAERVPAASADLVISGATLVDGTGAAARAPTMIVVRDGRITSVVPEGPSVAVPDAAQVIDATGKYMIPGLADMHVHFGLGSPFPHGPGTTEAVLARELYYGVTTVLQLGATDGSADAIRQLQARRRSGTLPAPHIYGTGGHLTLQGTHPIYTIFPPDVRRAADALANETPLSDPVDLYSLGIGLSFVRTEEAARKAVRERAEGGMDAIKITVESGPTTFGDDHPQMSVDMIRDIVDEAIRHRLPVIAHISSLDELEAILAGGATAAAHAVWDRPLPDGATADRMAAAGLFVIPTLALYSGAISLRYIDEPVNLDDPFLRETLSDDEVAALRNPEFIRRYRLGGAAPEDPGIGPAETIRRRVEEVLDNVGMLHRHGVPMVLGTDTGNPYVFPGYSVHREMELLVRAGLTPMEALEAATRRAAEMIGAEREFGTIERGKRADLLILGANPVVDIRNTRSVEMVIIDGRVVDRKALRDGIR